MIYFTADQHFDHENIIKFCERPFKTIRLMNHAIIENNNEIVTNDDIVYHLGDITLRGPVSINVVRQFIGKLKGQKHLILGNHDRLTPKQYLNVGFLSVHTSLELEIENLILVHDPALSAVDRKRVFLCGHVHDLFKTIKNVINVGVDQWDFKPVSLPEIREVIENEVILRNLKVEEI